MKQQRRQKGRKKPTRKEEKCMQCMYVLHSGLNYMKKFKKSQQPIDFNTLMQNHKNDLKKPYTKIYEKCSLQLLYDEKNTSKI